MDRLSQQATWRRPSMPPATPPRPGPRRPRGWKTNSACWRIGPSSLSPSGRTEGSPPPREHAVARASAFRLPGRGRSGARADALRILSALRRPDPRLAPAPQCVGGAGTRPHHHPGAPPGSGAPAGADPRDRPENRSDDPDRTRSTETSRSSCGDAGSLVLRIAETDAGSRGTKANHSWDQRATWHRYTTAGPQSLPCLGGSSLSDHPDNADGRAPPCPGGALLYCGENAWSLIIDREGLGTLVAAYSMINLMARVAPSGRTGATAPCHILSGRRSCRRPSPHGQSTRSTRPPRAPGSIRGWLCSSSSASLPLAFDGATMLGP